MIPRPVALKKIALLSLWSIVDVRVMLHVIPSESGDLFAVAVIFENAVFFGEGGLMTWGSCE